MNCILITSKRLLSFSQWTQMSRLQSFSFWRLPYPARPERSGSSLTACVRLSRSLDILSKLFVHSSKDCFGDQGQHVHRGNFLKLQSWQQTCSDCKFHKNLFACLASSRLSSLQLICCIYSSWKRNLALTESQKSYQERILDENGTIPTFSRLHRSPAASLRFWRCVDVPVMRSTRLVVSTGDRTISL